MATDWRSIQLKYVTSEQIPSLMVFASDNSVDYKTLCNRIAAEGWKSERKQHLADLFTERRNKAIATSVEEYQAATSRNVSLALLLQDIIEIRLNQVKNEELQEPGQTYADDSDEDAPKPYRIRSSDIVNYSNAIKNIGEILRTSNDIATGLANLVSAGIVTRVQATKIQAAVGAGESTMRECLAAAFEPEGND